VAVSQLGALTRQLADALVPLRALVVDPAFDASRTLGGIRQVSAVLTSYTGLDGSLGDCPETAGLASQFAGLTTRADAALTTSLEGSITDRPTQRDAGVRLVALLPEVLALSEAGKEAADRLGVELAVAEVPEGATDPIGNLVALAPPKPVPTTPPTVQPPSANGAVTITAAFFDGGVTIKTFRVRGTTQLAILHSIAANGPYNSWTGGHLSGQTRTQVTYRYHTRTTDSGACGIVLDANPPVSATFGIDLPRWVAPSKATAATIKWWNKHVRGIATHEKVHVNLFRDAVKASIATLQDSTCANVEQHLKSIWADTQRENCEFDMREYGKAAGLTLKACLVR
jgi:predicted secreted Zn-dependent protease